MASVQNIGQCLQIVHVDILYFILLTHILFIMWLKIEVFSVSSDKFSLRKLPTPTAFPSLLLSLTGKVLSTKNIYFFFKKITDFAKITIFLLILFHISRMFITLQILYKLL